MTAPLELTPDEEQTLRQIVQSRTEEVRLVQRAALVLSLAQGGSHRAVATAHRTTRKTVLRWHLRYLERRIRAPEEPVKSRLLDRPRTGAPDRITPEQYVDLLVLATTEPEALGLPLTHWSSRDLADQAVARGIVATLHDSTMSRFLSACDLKPHRVQGWMNRKQDPEFDERATRVKEVLAQAVSPEADKTHATVSFDEKTGIQALERIVADKPMQPGRPTKQEFEYRRNGTVTLLAMMLIHLGRVMAMVLPTRTNQDTAMVLHLHLGLLLLQGYRHITVVLDQLNTHMSLEVVQQVAQLCGLPPPDLSTLETMKQRRQWLERSDKPIVFLFTPKHASWLNPIELWFGVLVRKALRRGSFGSVEELRAKLYSFIEYYNERLAHPYKLRQLRKSRKAA